MEKQGTMQMMIKQKKWLMTAIFYLTKTLIVHCEK